MQFPGLAGLWDASSGVSLFSGSAVLQSTSSPEEVMLVLLDAGCTVTRASFPSGGRKLHESIKVKTANALPFRIADIGILLEQSAVFRCIRSSMSRQVSGEGHCQGSLRFLSKDTITSTARRTLGSCMRQTSALLWTELSSRMRVNAFPTCMALQ